MTYENNDKKLDTVYSSRIKAGKRRTYFFDVRATRGNDYYLTITESRKKFNNDGYDRHKIFLYKEDFNKFIRSLGEAIDHVKTELMPDFDFDAFNHDYSDLPDTPAPLQDQHGVDVSSPAALVNHEDLPADVQAQPEGDAAGDSEVW